MGYKREIKWQRNKARRQTEIVLQPHNKVPRPDAADHISRPDTRPACCRSSAPCSAGTTSALPFCLADCLWCQSLCWGVEALKSSGGRHVLCYKWATTLNAYVSEKKSNGCGSDGACPSRLKMGKRKCYLWRLVVGVGYRQAKDLCLCLS